LLDGEGGGEEVNECREAVRGRREVFDDDVDVWGRGRGMGVIRHITFGGNRGGRRREALVAYR
jgi:hypothetical protein